MLPGQGERAKPAHTDQRTALQAECASFARVELAFPFGEDTAVYKVGGKMFALISLDGEPGSVTLKCDPEAGVGLRNTHTSITPGYYMNKRHWITVALEGDVPPELLGDLTLDSYELIVSSLPVHLRPPPAAPPV